MWSRDQVGLLLVYTVCILITVKGGSVISKHSSFTSWYMVAKDVRNIEYMLHWRYYHQILNVPKNHKSNEVNQEWCHHPYNSVYDGNVEHRSEQSLEWLECIGRAFDSHSLAPALMRLMICHSRAQTAFFARSREPRIGLCVGTTHWLPHPRTR